MDRNAKLNKLFTKGSEYRKNNNIHWIKFKISIMVGLSEYIDTWCSKHGVDKSAVTKWKYKVINVFDDKINMMSFMSTTTCQLP